MYNQGNGTWKTTAPSGGGGSNLPSGFTQIESRNFDSATETGWWPGGASFSVVTSPGSEAQSTSGNVGQYFFPNGYAGGEAPGSTGIDLGNSLFGFLARMNSSYDSGSVFLQIGRATRQAPIKYFI